MAMVLATAGPYGRRPVRNDGVFAASHDLTSWGSSSPHEGHRLWANMPVEFWVYVYKVELCRDPSSHDWRLCPFAHRGERVRRRNPWRYPYLGVACPDYYRAPSPSSHEHHHHHPLRSSRAAPTCARGQTCRFAHGVFELWLHPERFRTRMCDAGRWCPRSICFFAHYPSQRRREDDPVPVIDRGRLIPYAIPRVPPPQHVISPSSSPLPRLAAAGVPPTLPVHNDGSSSVVGSTSRLRHGAEDEDLSDRPCPDFDEIVMNLLNHLRLA